MKRLAILIRRPRAATAAAVLLTLALAGTALAASRYSSWRLGVVESLATYTTGISGAMAGSVLSLTNTNTSTTATVARAISAVTRAPRSVALFAQNTAGGAAAQFLVRPDTGSTISTVIAPFIVNSRKVVANLNADYLDGLSSAAFQREVTGSCAVGEKVTSISDTGAVVCAADIDTNTTYTGTAPITVSGGTIGLSGTAERCATGDVYKFGGTEGETRGWACGPDAIDGGDAATLGGVAPSGYLASTGKASDADKLDGNDSSAFLGASAKATDADKLDGIDSARFVQVRGSGTVTIDPVIEAGLCVNYFFSVVPQDISNSHLVVTPLLWVEKFVFRGRGSGSNLTIEVCNWGSQTIDPPSMSVAWTAIAR